MPPAAARDGAGTQPARYVPPARIRYTAVYSGYTFLELHPTRCQHDATAASPSGRRMLEPTLAAFPRDPATKDAAGVPFGCVAQPLAPFTDYVLAEDELEHADAVARCDSCFGYISSHCQFLRHHWRCSLCGALNPTPARYATARRDKLPELAHAAVELRLGDRIGQVEVRIGHLEQRVARMEGLIEGAGLVRPPEQPDAKPAH